MNVNNWMSWEGGVDLVALTDASLPMPNVIVHVARMVHTPVGSAPAGMILIPDETGAPKVMGFVSSDQNVCEYFGPNIFAGTPFETAPNLNADITIDKSGDDVSAKIRLDGTEIVLSFAGLGELERVDRQSPNLPFHDASIEASASHVKLTVNGEELKIIIPPQGMSGGPAAVYSAAGIYSR